MFAWVPRARPRAAGHPLSVPRRYQGAGRVDNPDLYGCLYCSDSAAGAVAEAFARYRMWSEEMFRGPAQLPGSAMALVAYEPGRASFADLDDPAELLERSLRPSRVVASDRAVTQEWARRIFAEGRWAGASWWCPLDSRWATVGVWDTRSLRAREVVALTRAHPAVAEAAERLDRAWCQDSPPG